MRIAAIVATVGTTDAFGVDDVASLATLRDQLIADHGLDYVPHLHADAVIARLPGGLAHRLLGIAQGVLLCSGCGGGH
jgi:hypothetical protein